MKKISLLLCIVLLVLTLAGCKGNAADGANAEYKYSDDAYASESKLEADETYTSLTITSNAISGNYAQNSYTQNIYVYLPPSYYSSTKSYPVVYYLHDFMESSNDFLSGIKDALDANFASNPKEFILVGIDGKTNVGGSFYVNSTITGNWENYVIDEVVPLIDNTYRTIPGSASRGICGYSMGGFGAYNLALKYPDIFGSVLAVSPYVMPDDSVAALMESWTNETELKYAYGQAFSPNISNGSYCNVPAFTGTDDDNAVIAQWQTGIGDISGKIAAYNALGIQLKNVKIVYGAQDYTWLTEGCEALSAALGENGVNCTVDVFDGAHDMPAGIADNQIIPYFDSVLQFE